MNAEALMGDNGMVGPDNKVNAKAAARKKAAENKKKSGGYTYGFLLNEEN